MAIWEIFVTDIFTSFYRFLLTFSLHFYQIFYSHFHFILLDFYWHFYFELPFLDFYKRMFFLFLTSFFLVSHLYLICQIYIWGHKTIASENNSKWDKSGQIVFVPGQNDVLGKQKLFVFSYKVCRLGQRPKEVSDGISCGKLR